jgi:uncharacterized protein YndB with AHSA1/START domain
MSNNLNSPISISTTVNAPVDKAWETWSDPEHIVKWSTASPDWHTPTASNDLRKGGRFTSRMEAKDGSMGFDFGGVYDDVQKNKLIIYTLDDNRKVEIRFIENGNSTIIEQDFEAEQQNSREMQQMGWQAILDNYKTYIESL